MENLVSPWFGALTDFLTNAIIAREDGRQFALQLAGEWDKTAAKLVRALPDDVLRETYFESLMEAGTVVSDALRQEISRRGLSIES